jgi:ABC-type multidrug transport system ATPase subunit
VLRGVTLEALAGDLIHVGGANGSGKTSLLRVAAGLARPASGRIERVGRCAYVPEKVLLAGSISCEQWLSTTRALRGLGQIAWSNVLEESGLKPDVVTSRTGTLSKGMLQRIALVEAVQVPQSLLLLDEPFGGLDSAGRGWLAAAITEATSNGSAVIFTDHSGSAGQILTPTTSVVLRDSTCEQAPQLPEAEPNQIVVRASHADGRNATHSVDADSSDALLSDLLTDGWHIEELRR